MMKCSRIRALTTLGRLCLFTSVIPLYAAATWNVISTMPTPRVGAGLFQGPDRLMYVVGGYTWASASRIPSNVVEIYNPATNAWTTGPAMPRARYNIATAVANGKAYVIGGW